MFGKKSGEKNAERMSAKCLQHPLFWKKNLFKDEGVGKDAGYENQF